MPDDSKQAESTPVADGRRVVREARPSDSAVIKQILSDASLSSLETSDPPGATTNQTAANRVHVCELDNNVVAVLQWRQVAQEVEIFDLAVDIRFRRHGIASFLLENVLALAKDRGANQIFLEVRESNAAAIALYRKFGFSATGHRPNYYRDSNEAALLLRLEFTG